MVSKADLRVTNGYIIGVSQRSVCSGVVCTQILSHLSPWLSEAKRSVTVCNGRATLECFTTQGKQWQFHTEHRYFTLNDTLGGLYVSFCQHVL